ncbi:hypothetical protein SANTM175S_03326 [Streptomyces antimycoticus]
MVAPKAGKARQQGNSVGDYICSDLACSLYVRGKKDAGAGSRPRSRSPWRRRSSGPWRLAAFLAKVTA